MNPIGAPFLLTSLCQKGLKESYGHEFLYYTEIFLKNNFLHEKLKNK